MTSMTFIDDKRVVTEVDVDMSFTQRVLLLTSCDLLNFFYVQQVE